MTIQVKVPGLGESVKQAKLLKWHKQDGQSVGVDEPICELESDKANADVTAESAGIIHPKKREGEMVEVGDVIAEIDPTGFKSAPPAEQKKPAPAPPPPPRPPHPPRGIQPPGCGPCCPQKTT